jgi:hypothetical protein
MTTSNAVETAVIPHAVSIPLEAVANEGNVPYAYKLDGGRVVRQQIELGLMNDDDIIVQHGLSKDDRVLLSPPAEKSRIQTVRLPGGVPKPPPPGRGDTSRAIPIAGVSR